MLEGLLGIGIAIITLFAPRVTAVALLFYIATWTLPMGVLEIVVAIRLRKEIEGEFWLFFTGLVSVVFAVLLLLFPGRGILGPIRVLSIYAVVFGNTAPRTRVQAAGAGSTCPARATAGRAVSPPRSGCGARPCRPRGAGTARR